MKAVILAGELGTRISEESGVRPQPLVEIGGRRILWYILKLYSAHGIDDIVNSFHMSDAAFDMKDNRMEVHRRGSEHSRVMTIVDTGESTMTGGRLRGVREYLGNERSVSHMVTA